MHPRSFLLAAALAGTALPALAAGLTPQDLTKLRGVTAAAISPDGSRIAYIKAVPRTPFVDDDGPAFAELHLVDIAGNSKPLIAGEVSIGDISWTPDGRGISFLTQRGKDTKRSLYVIPPDGGEARRVLAHGSDIGAYSWSPDGRKVAFLATEPTPKELEEARKKGFSQQVYEESAEPARVWLAEPEKPKDEPKKLDLPGSASELHWSPAGDKLAVALAPTPSVDDGYMRRRVHVVNVADGKVAAKIENPGKLGAVRWSPDGKLLAIISAADIHDPAEGRLMVIPAGGGELKDLIPSDDGHVIAIDWVDEETIGFLRAEGTKTLIGKVGADGSDLYKHELPVIALGLDVANRRAALVADSAKHPGEVYTLTESEPEARRLTNSNDWLGAAEFGSQEVVSFKARDGLELEGVLIKPVGHKEGDRVPLILAVHGGPESNIFDGWLTSYANPGQVAAARGFAVFYPNYRGSTGRGVAFSKLGQGDPAGKEFDDLVDAVDALVEKGIADKAKVGVTGGSYGGYASGWGATYYSDRFAASVMFVGISDKISKTGTTDIPSEEYLVHALHHPWEKWQFFLERSPIYYATKCKTPLLILHGKDDPRVFPSQSMELYRFVKTLGKTPVRLVFYPGEGHGNRRSASRYDYNLRMLQWMEHYLKGPGGAAPPYEIAYPK